MDIQAWIVTNEGSIRFAAFSAFFLACAWAESRRPDLPRIRSRLTRWSANLGLSLSSAVLLRILLPGAAVLAAVFVQTRGWGALNAVDWPLWIEVLVAMALLDLAIYVQHVLTHRVPILWRVHRVHHADREVDVTTALRFHPVEMVFSMLYKVAVVAALGAHPLSVVLFEVVLNACAMFNYSNMRLSPRADALVRAVLVTPAMHRVHHSETPVETNANFGFSLSLWDRIFGTYRAVAASPLTLGLPDYRDERPHQLWWTLTLPFRSRA